MTGPNGYSPEDNSQLYCLREGLVNMLAHADYFSPIHSTIIVFNDRIEFQNPGQFPIALRMGHGKVKSIPRNPNIIMFYRHARLAENAGYGIGRIMKWNLRCRLPLLHISDRLPVRKSVRKSVRKFLN